MSFDHSTSIPESFNYIAQRYDVTTQCLSLGTHRIWKRKIGQYLPQDDHLHVLDLATGTGDVAIELATHFPCVQKVAGLDLSENMLSIAESKVEELGLSEQITFHLGDACCIPFEESQFDAVTIAFGIRNIADRDRMFSAIQHVLKPGGRLIVLEFSKPENSFWKFLHTLYMNVVVRFLGSVISRDHGAFQYLYSSIKNYPHGEPFCQILAGGGFENVFRIPLFLGAVTIYVAENSVRGALS